MLWTKLGYPVSSGAAMLKSLVSLGYLEYDRKTQTYLPTMRIAVAGALGIEQLSAKSECCRCGGFA